MFERKPDLICANCGGTKTKRVPKGSLGIEIVLWLCFLFPGLFYSIWRQGTYRNICCDCGSENVIPKNSVLGKKLLKDIAES